MNSNISSFKTNSTCFSEQKVRAPIICPKEISCTQLTNQYKHFTNTCAAIYLKNVSDPKPTSSEVRHKIDGYEIPAPDFELWAKSGCYVAWNPILQCLDLSFSKDYYCGLSNEQKDRFQIISKFPVIKKTKDHKMSKQFNEILRISKSFEILQKSKNYFAVPENSSETESVKSAIIYPTECEKNSGHDLLINDHIDLDEDFFVDNTLEYEETAPEEIMSRETKKELIEDWFEKFDNADRISFSKIMTNQESNLTEKKEKFTSILDKKKELKKKKKSDFKGKSKKIKSKQKKIFVAQDLLIEQTVVIEEPVVEETVVIEEPVVEETVVIEEPVVEETVVIEEPVVEETVVIEEPVVEETVVIEEPVVEEKKVSVRKTFNKNKKKRTFKVKNSFEDKSRLEIISEYNLIGKKMDNVKNLGKMVELEDRFKKKTKSKIETAKFGLKKIIAHDFSEKKPFVKCAWFDNPYTKKKYSPSWEPLDNLSCTSSFIGAYDKKNKVNLKKYMESRKFLQKTKSFNMEEADKEAHRITDEYYSIIDKGPLEIN